MSNQPEKILVTDFDGTMTQQDFYELVLQHLLEDDVPDFWTQYRTGKITHFEALQGYFANIRVDEPTLLALVARMELDPDLRTATSLLRASHWKVIVASAGCRWYIDRLLAEAEVEIEVHANPGEFRSGEGLQMTLPESSPFFSSTIGIDKAGIVQHHLDRGAVVAFAGDGFPDADAARLVAGELRFARGALATVLDREGLPYHSFKTWSDIARKLTATEAAR
jgi:2-hydroxy-3-keto-5-methylthiopentenyl-1-phosphate phosphatase